MKLIRPITTTDAALVSSTVPETDHAAWASITTYALGARVIKAHRIWESTQAANTNHDPQLAGVGWWVDMGPTNRWAMFDGTVNTKTTAAGSMTVALVPGRINAIALFQVVASVATVTMRLGSEVVFERSLSLIDDSSIADWYTYFFEESKQKDYVLMMDLPVFGEAVTTVTLFTPSGNVSCGMCVVGLQEDLGGTLRGPALGINDYSQKITDDFGNSSLTQRSFSKRMGVKMVIDNSEVDKIHTALASVRAMPVVWVGSDKYSSMLLFGFYRDFEVDIAYVEFSYCTINIEGMI